MKVNKILKAGFILILAGASIVGCGKSKEATPSMNQTMAVPEILEGVSIDFEDGNYGFAIEASSIKGGDPSELSIEEVSGNKVLMTKNVNGNAEVFIGFDIGALLADKVTDVKTIQLEVGSAGDVFSAISGKAYVYTGDECKEEVAGKYSVYLDTDNPKKLRFDVSGTFAAGAGNYFIISKEENAADAPAELIFDNLAFFDKDGNLIEADSTAVLSKNTPLNAVAIDKGRLASGKEFDLGGGYAGDWSSTVAIPADYFKDLDGDVNVTVSIKLDGVRDYYLMAPIPADNWNKKLKEEDVVDMNVAEEGEVFHLQKDGFIKIDDLDANTVSFTITKEAAERYTKSGMGFQIFGIKISKAVVSTDTFVAVMDNIYKGDDETTSVIPAELFANANGDITVSVDVYLEEGKDHYELLPVTKDNQEISFANNLEINQDTDIVSFTLTKEEAKTIADNGGLTFKTFGVTAASAAVIK